jgi:hypothetical protein
MRMIRHHNRFRQNAVTTPKTRSAIPVTSPIHRDLLIQSTLDPTVRSIEFVNQVRHRGHAVATNTFVVHRDDGRFLMEVVGSRPQRDPDEDEALYLGLQAAGIQVLEVEPDEIRREPRYRNARLVWENREHQPSARDRERILDVLAENGPLSIGEIEDLTRTTSDIETAVCSLACEDIVEVDLDGGPLGAATVVRARR